MFDSDRFVEDCLTARAEDDSHKAVAEVLQRAVSNPNEVLNGLGAPELGGVEQLYVSDDLTIINVVWPPFMTLKPHNHNMWAVIGVYTGREDNIFWRRRKADKSHIVEAAGAESLGPTVAKPLGKDIIHSVTNPIQKFTGAIHVYGGNFFENPRSEWDPETLAERPYDVEANVRIFQEANARLG